MGNIFGHRLAPPPPFTATVTERPRRRSSDEKVVDLLCVNDHIAVKEIRYLSKYYSYKEIGTITIQNPSPFTSFICEFTSLSTRAIDFYTSIIDHNVSCDMPSLQIDLERFVNTMLQETARARREFRSSDNLKLFCVVLFRGLVFFMYLYLTVLAYCFTCSDAEGCSILVISTLLSGIGNHVDKFLGRRVRILDAKHELGDYISDFSHNILGDIDYFVTTGSQDLNQLKERQQFIKNVKKIVFNKWKELSDLEDDRS